MWIFTKSGFVSVVQDRSDPDRLWVRGRVLEDLQSFRASVNTEVGPFTESIIELDASDYRFRLACTRRHLQAFLRAAARDLDYDNFKNAALEEGPSARSTAYHATWSAMYQLQSHQEDLDRRCGVPPLPGAVAGDDQYTTDDGGFVLPVKEAEGDSFGF